MEPTIAISYRRFSTAKQAKGDSVRRQTDLAEAYCERHGLTLVDTYLDAGLSGFTGENLGHGSALSALLAAANRGAFKAGTRLIIESMDRLSRREISMALRLFLDLLDTGLVIVTLIDGEQIFTKERIDSDLTALIIAIVYLSRANNESKNRRERALQAQQTARRKAREKNIPMTAECPAWLSVRGRGDKRRFIVDVGRARVIEEIFSMAASGMGQYQITQVLNRNNVRPFSGKSKWRPGMIGHLLANRAVLGHFQPCLSIVENGKRRRMPDPEGTIEGYFPEIIDPALFARAKQSTSSRLTRRGERQIPSYTNLVVRLGRCIVCGGALHHGQSVGGWAYLRCANARHHECPNRFGFPYQVIEAAVLATDRLVGLVGRFMKIASTGDYGLLEADLFARDPDRSELSPAFDDLSVAAQSADPNEHLLARKTLVLAIRRKVQGVVLHSADVLTVHLKQDAIGNQVVYVLGREGLQEVHVTQPTGTVGLIGRSILAAMIPVRARRRPERGVMMQPSVQGPDPERRVQIQFDRTPDGGWHAEAHHPTRVTEIVSRAEPALCHAKSSRSRV